MNIIIKYIQEEILNNSKEFELTLDDDLLGTGLIDSLGIMKLIRFLENSFEVKIPAEDMVIENFMSVEIIEEYLQNLKSK